MAIRMTFPNPADSPTGNAVVRVRYSVTNPGPRAVVSLRYAHGTRALTRDAWAGFAAGGATIWTDSDRERQIVREALGAWITQPLRTDAS